MASIHATRWQEHPERLAVMGKLSASELSRRRMTKKSQAPAPAAVDEEDDEKDFMLPADRAFVDGRPSPQGSDDACEDVE